MAQGKLKVKNKKMVPPKGKKKKGGDHKPVKRGGKAIVPKKQHMREAAKIKKGLENAVKINIERELRSRASQEGKPFKLLDSKITNSKSKKGKKAPKK